MLPPPPVAYQQAPSQPAQQPAKKKPARASRPKRPPRRARLRLTRIDPWSVMKTAFLLSIALGVVTIVSVLMVWSVLGAAGVWDSINTTVRDVVGDQASTPFTVQDYLGTDRVIGFTMLVAVIDVVLLTAIATLAAFLYNMAAALLGGIDITLVEDEHCTLVRLAIGWRLRPSGIVPPRSPSLDGAVAPLPGPIAQTVRALP